MISPSGLIVRPSGGERQHVLDLSDPAAAISPNDGHPRLRAMLAAYLDESIDEKLLTVAGWASPVEKWWRFAAEWSKLLRREGLEGKSLSRANLTPDNDVYVGEEDRLDALLAECMTHISENTEAGVSVSIRFEDFTAVMDKRGLARVGEGTRNQLCYALCGIGCIGLLLDWIASEQPGAHIDVIFESGMKGFGKIDLFTRMEHAPNLTLTVPALSKKTVVQLQAADFLAWESRRHAQAVIDGADPNDMDDAHCFLLAGKYGTGRMRGGYWEPETVEARLREVLTRAERGLFRDQFLALDPGA